MENQEKYQAVCQFFHFSERYGRNPTDADKGTVNKMAEQLTKIAGEFFEERVQKDHKVPATVDISIKAYEEFSARLQKEKLQGDTQNQKLRGNKRNKYKNSKK